MNYSKVREFPFAIQYYQHQSFSKIPDRGSMRVHSAKPLSGYDDFASHTSHDSSQSVLYNLASPCIR